MATWTNIFDLGEWDVYVRYDGITAAPSEDAWVLAADLDPAVGTVEVIDGLIVCSFEAAGGSGGVPTPSIVVMPKFSISAPCRLTCPDFGSINTNTSYFGAEVSGVTSNGDGTFTVHNADLGNAIDYANQSEWALPTEAPEPLPLSYGMEFRNVSPGF